MKKFSTVDEYHTAQPKDTKAVLNQLRKTIKQTASKSEEVISYNMPAYKYYGTLVYYAAYAHHIGFYPMPSAIKAFKDKLKPYKTSKGAIQFPLDKKLPLSLIKNIVKFRMKENEGKVKMKVTKKP